MGNVTKARKNLRYAYIRDGKQTGRVVAVVDPKTVNQHANKGIDFKQVQAIVNALENSDKWERVGNDTPVSEGRSTRVVQAEIRSKQTKADQDREQRAHVATAEAIAKAVKGA